MTTKLIEDNYNIIQLLSYDRPNDLTEIFYFLEMSTLQATTFLSNEKKIISTKIIAYTDDNKHLDESIIESFKIIGDFNDFFINNANFYIHNCNIELEDGIHLSSHDDGEVSVKFIGDNADQIIIDTIFDKYNLDKKLIKKIKAKPGHYIAIDKQNNITDDFKDFDDYVENGRT